MASLDEALTLQRDPARTSTGGEFTAEIPADWTQGRATFGGLLGALVLRAAAAEAGPTPFRSMILSFVAPAGPGPLRIRARIVRSGRAITQLAVELVQDDVVALATVVLGVDRPSLLDVAPEPAPTWDLTHLPTLPFLPGVTPTFTQHFEYRYAEGGFPFTGHPSAALGGAVRTRVPTPVDHAVAVALLDAWPPPAFPMLRAPAPGSTVTWHVTAVSDPSDAPVDGFFRYTGRATSCARGFMDCDAKLWRPDGRLVLTGRQLVAEFSAR